QLDENQKRRRIAFWMRFSSVETRPYSSNAHGNKTKSCSGSGPTVTAEPCKMAHQRSPPFPMLSPQGTFRRGYRKIKRPFPPTASAGSVAKLAFGGKIRKSALGKSTTCESQLSCFR